MSYTFELSDVVRDDVVMNEAQMTRAAEICSALFDGSYASACGRDADAVVARMRGLGSRAAAGDGRARSEINQVLRLVIQPRLIEALKLFSYLGNYHEMRYEDIPTVRTYSELGTGAKVQASGSPTEIVPRLYDTYTVTPVTVSGGMAVDYRELSAGRFDGVFATELANVRADISNKALAYALGVLKTALKANSTHVKFYSEYTGELTQTAVDTMLGKLRHFGKVTVAGDFGSLAAVCGFNGYKTVGSTTIPFASERMVDELASTGLNGFYKGAALVELPNPYDTGKPKSDLSAFASVLPEDTLYFLVKGEQSPFNIFRCGDVSTLTGTDVESGLVKTRFDLRIAADVAKGREYEIGMIVKA